MRTFPFRYELQSYILLKIPFRYYPVHHNRKPLLWRLLHVTFLVRTKYDLWGHAHMGSERSVMVQSRYAIVITKCLLTITIQEWIYDSIVSIVLSLHVWGGDNGHPYFTLRYVWTQLWRLGSSSLWIDGILWCKGLLVWLWSSRGAVPPWARSGECAAPTARGGREELRY